ncbi:hypothetical protein [Mycoplasma nasistruthionis]|uniref:Helix-turn-helix domain-containing protein n=1 Tax=Mycoplasma nasistruthionis TaxID=353852 RepID=A0A4Y6I565_9MOLU|nr:hypothetical protein [Mycoplasma nasistruthionis]QDF64734.1 hypothetical protein FIV53_00110 [Mycoplasma nasistruthionis]
MIKLNLKNANLSTEYEKNRILNLKTIAIHKNWTNEQLSLKTGLSVRTIIRYKRKSLIQKREIKVLLEQNIKI